MGWEERRGRSYYYRSVREGARVRKEYCGGGVLGQLAAQLDEVERLRRQEHAAQRKGELELLEQSTEFLRELTEVTETLTRAHLIADGFRYRKGEWRRARERET